MSGRRGLPIICTPSPVIPLVFLSYANADRDRVGALHAFLSEQSLPLWWDQDIPAGATFRDEIADRLISAAAVFVLWTEHSTKSKGVFEEAAKAQSNGKLVHARLDDAPLPYGFAETQYVDLSGWDGTATHPAMRKLLQALRDKLNPPSEAEIVDRIHRASPVAMTPHEGKLSPLDTPPHVRPEADNPADLDDRLRGLRQRLASVQEMADGRYQLPDDLHHCLAGVGRALDAEPPTWYGLEDAKDSLSHCMVVHDAAEAWNDVIVQGLLRIVSRINELRPLLQPRQVPAGEPGAKPPEPDPVIKRQHVAAVVDLAEQVERELDTDEAGRSLDARAKALVNDQTAHIEDASQEADNERKLPRLRTALRKLAYLTGSIISGRAARSRPAS